MEGREHTGVIVTMTKAGAEDQIRAWFDRWRARWTGGEAHSEAICFRVSKGYDLGGATHVAIRETAGGEAAAGGDDEATAHYSKIADFGPIKEGRTRGVVLVFTDCDDPALEDGYNEWYSGHLHHTVESIDFYAATRYVSDDPSRTPSKYLAIYETENTDPAQVQKDGVDWWVQGDFEGPPGMVLRNEVPVERID
jgi:hypothetical protein